jgi:hypothetical protein
MGYFEAEPKPGRPPKVKVVCERMHPDGTEAKWCTLDPDHSGDHSDGTDTWPPG